MNCNKITTPDFSDEQIAECRKCKYASANVNRTGRVGWCGLFGVRISNESKIIVPDRKIITPQQRPYLNMEHAGFQTQEERFKHHYKVALEGANGSNSVVSEQVFVKRRQACAVCPPTDKQGCPCIGCKQWSKLVFADAKCPLKKW